MLKYWVFLLLISTPSTLAFAQRQSEPDTYKEPPPSTVCVYPYSSGSKFTQTQYCLSLNGNIVQFSRPSDAEYIREGTIVEGYGVCDRTSAIAYYDYADKNTGNWGESVVSVPRPSTRKFIRATSDGVWQLTQSIVQGKASGSRPGTVQVTMSLKNLGSVTRDVYLVRVADVDLAGAFDDDLFSVTWDTASAQDSRSAAYGLALTNNTFTVSGRAITTGASGIDPCDFWGNRGNFVGDGSIGHQYIGTIKPSSIMTVTMTYRPI
jgi:hypothetical protein